MASLVTGNQKKNVYHFVAAVLSVPADGLALAGGRLNKKDGLTRYGDSHVKDKTS